MQPFFQVADVAYREEQKLGTDKSKQVKFPAENSPSAYDCFDWLHCWIKAADWSMVPIFKFFRGLLKLRLLY